MYDDFPTKCHQFEQLSPRTLCSAESCSHQFYAAYDVRSSTKQCHRCKLIELIT